MGNNKSKPSIKIPYHFIYVYINDKINIPEISIQLLLFIKANIELLKQQYIFNIYYISYDDIKHNQSLVNLLKKNHINNLPALKIKDKKNSSNLYVGTNAIIEYYFSQLGNKIYYRLSDIKALLNANYNPKK
jgi:hypothetical protein